MARETRISFAVQATGPGLRLHIDLDGENVRTVFPRIEPQEITVTVDDEKESQHCLSLTMTGKTQAHTRLDADGGVAEDLLVSVTGFSMDGTELGHVLTKSSCYTHDRNGTSATMTEPFYGIMGCNGRVDFRFASPTYLWLLENR